MNTIKKRIALFVLVAALLVPTLSVSAAEAPERIDGAPAKTEESSPKATVEPGTIIAPASAIGGKVDGTDSTANTTPPTATPGVNSSPSTGGTVATSSRISYPAVKANISYSLATSTEIRGWLYLTNTNISAPIPIGPNNNYYGNRTWEGVEYPGNDWRNYKETAIYLDHRVKIGKTWGQSSSNIVVYGHNWSNLKAPYDIGNVTGHSMFGQLPSYNDITFTKNNPYLYFSTGDMEGIWKVFAVAYSETTPAYFPYNSPNLDPSSLTHVINEWQQRSMYKFDFDVKDSDQLLTLTTCTRNYADVGNEQRFTVVARRLRPGETDKDPVTVTVNPTIKAPKF